MREIKKFQFVVPNTRWFGKRCWMWDVPGVTILTPILKKNGYDVNVLEANLENLTFNQVKEEIKKYNPDVVGISNMSIEYWQQLHEVAKITKEVNQDIITIAGGIHATTLPERLMQDTNVDFVVLSEGEERLIHLLDILKKDDGDFSKMNGILYRENTKLRKIPASGWYGTKNNGNLDDIYPPDLTIYNKPERFFNHQQKAVGGMATRRTPSAPILTSRGCPYRCSFCAAPVTTGHKFRYRSPENVLAEIDMLVKQYGVKEIIFQDDEMFAHKKRIREIIQMIKDRKYDLIWKSLNIASWRLDYDLIKLMKESGCYQITISAESGNPRVLKEIIHKPTDIEMAKKVVKWCRELGVETHVDFVIGFPGETWDEIRDTTNYAYELDADSVKFAVATPFPATELLRVSVEKGLFPKDYDFYTHDYLGFANPTIDTEHWSANDLRLLRVFEWDRINFGSEEKKKRYAKVNEMTIEEVEKFRKQTRENLGYTFFDQSEKERTNKENKEIKESKDQKWKNIRRVAAQQSKIAQDNDGKTFHEII